MMQFIIMPAITGIITLGIYGVFELLIRRKERLRLIEKINDDKIIPEMIGSGITLNAPKVSSTPFGTLKIASILVGLGVGIIVGHIIGASIIPPQNEYNYDGLYEGIVAASVLACSGLGLIVSFIIEIKMNKRK